MSIDETSINSDKVKIRAKKVSKKLDRSISCKDLGKGDCEGWLWIKKISILKNKFVRRWCVLKSHCFYVYIHIENERAEMIINLEDFKICPMESFKSKNFYFKIYNSKVNFTFAIESQTGFMKWLNKLQISASNIDLESIEGQIAGFIPGYTKVNPLETLQETDSNESAGYSESEDSDVQSDKVSCDTSTDNASVKDNYKMKSAEPINNPNRTSAELSEITMNAIKRVIEIERQMREKRQLLIQIETFLKYPVNSYRIQEFWDDYGDQITKL